MCMFSPDSYEYYGHDLYNRNGLRNVRNTVRHTYNCGGYALGTFSWYLPYESDRYGFVWGNHLTAKRMNEITNKCVEFMLHDFADLRVIDSIADLAKGEYAIAFRLSSDGDFHYIKRNCMGLWTHKRGASSKIWVMLKDEVLNSVWCNRYDGKIVLFAKKMS